LPKRRRSDGKKHWGGSAVLLGFIATQFLAAERPTERRADADLVVVGKVSGVFIRETEGYKHYLIEVYVESMEKGSGRRGDILRLSCYQRRPGKDSLEFDSAGHSAVPKEGQRIKAFANAKRGRNEGIYPEWFDVLPNEKADKPRPSIL
jgi:hypothetical protein